MPVPQRDQTIDRRPLRMDVFARLRDAIVEGAFAPGEQVKDVEIADWLGVSRTPVREALLRLSEVGLVTSRPGHSTTISPLDPRDVHEARDVVAAMHRLAVREAVGGLSADELDRMRAANDRFRAAVLDGDIHAALSADDELHAIPVAAAANRAVQSVLDQFTPQLRRAELLRFASLDGRASIVRHDELIRLCAAGDADAAGEIAYDTWHSLSAAEASARGDDRTQP